jgi:hypothetical protein
MLQLTFNVHAVLPIGICKPLARVLAVVAGASTALFDQCGDVHLRVAIARCLRRSLAMCMMTGHKRAGVQYVCSTCGLLPRVAPAHALVSTCWKRSRGGTYGLYS